MLYGYFVLMLFAILVIKMHVSDKTVRELLAQHKKLSEAELTKLEQTASRQKKHLQDLIVKQAIVTDEELVQWYAAATDIPYVQLDPKAIDPSLLKLVPERIARRYNAVVFGEENGVRQLAMEDPDDVQAVDFIQKQLGSKPALYLATKQNIASVIDMYRGEMSSELTKVISEDTEGESDDTDVSEEDLAEDSPIAQTVTLLIEFAIKSNASDIHIEPYERDVVYRFRINGVMTEILRQPAKRQVCHPRHRGEHDGIGRMDGTDLKACGGHARP